MEIWYVEHPLYQYSENVKELAQKAGLKIIDAQFQGEEKQCEKAPKLSKIGQLKKSKEE